jgi:hypothetical protein
MKLKEKYAYYILEKRVAQLNRKVVIPSISERSKVGVLWLPEEKEAFSYLHNHFTKAHAIFRNLCVYNKKLPTPPNSSSITKNELNWLGIPSSPAVDEFVQTEFDLLLNIAMEQNFVMDYFTALSRAKFKIGWSPKEKNYFDLNINIESNKDALYLAKQQIFYLGQLNKTKSDE